jgi:predicted RNA-binding Zn-ribbon protein involved in translation (DUF1610 family)
MNFTREEAFEYIFNAEFSKLSEKEIEGIFLDMSMDYCSGMVSDVTKRQVVLESIRYRFRGAPNKYIANYIRDIFGIEAIVTGKLESLFPCPCCGARSLDELYNRECATGYDICEYCGWEDDGTTDPNKRSSVNRGTMNEYRSNLSLDALNRSRWVFIDIERHT